MEMREKADSKFHELFSDAVNCSEEIDSEIKIPRIARRQNYRENYGLDKPEDNLSRCFVYSVY